MKFYSLAFFLISFVSSNIFADQFHYEVKCMPTEFEDVARVVRGKIWLALRADKSISKSIISVRIRDSSSPVHWKSETDLLEDTGFNFNTEDLSLSLGGDVSGHSCYAPANLLIDLEVTKKDGRVISNKGLVIPIRVPGALATMNKYIESEGKN